MHRIRRIARHADQFEFSEQLDGPVTTNADESKSSRRGATHPIGQTSTTRDRQQLCGTDSAECRGGDDIAQRSIDMIELPDR